MGISLKRRARSVESRHDRLASATAKAVIELLESRRLLSTTYYVATTGSDSNAGTSSSTPWASVAKVDATTFNPGDTILFQYGGEWHGQLIASASGTAGNPITYGAYGNASLARPTFDGSDVIPANAFTLVSGNTYSFPISAVPNSNGNAYWVYANHAGMLAAAAGDNSSGGVQSNSNSFYINGSTAYINTGGTNPAANGVVYTLGDRGAGTAANSSLIDSNGFSYITFQNIVGRETAEVGGGNQLGGGISDGYVYRIQGGSNVTLSNDDGEYGSKHIYGAIDTSAFLAQSDTAEGAPEGVAGNGLPYGNATAMVAYADNANGNTADTQSWINDTVTNYDGGQPAFLTHANDAGDISNLTITNFNSNGSPVSLSTPGGETINYSGGTIVNNTLTVYAPPVGAPASPELINGVTITGSGSNYTQLLVSGGATVQNCVITYGNQGAIQVLGSNNVIRFNTLVPLFYAPGIALQNNSNDTPTTGEQIYGNLFTASGTGISTQSGDTFSADYDFFDSGQGSPTFNINGSSESLATFQAAGYETHAVVGTPAFTSPTSGNYSLTSSSQAINVVPTSAVSPAVPTDILGDARPSANIYDAGAYEYQSVLHQPTVATPASASPSTVTGTTTNLSVLGASPDGEPTLLYNWTDTGPGSVTFSANGTNASKNTTATFTKAGTYTFTATITNGQYSTTSSVNVTVSQASQGLSITPSQWFVSINTTKQFTASVNDQFGNPISGPSITYSIQSGPGSINSTGLFTAPSTSGGTTVIKATSGSVSSTATANIVQPNQAPTVATQAASNPNPVTGTTAQLSVLGADDNGEGNLTYTWSTVGTPPATVSYNANGTNAAKNTTVTFTANGNYNFLVTITDQGGLTTTSSVTVTVNTFVPIVLDGNLDGRYGAPIATQDVATNYGNNNLGSPIAPYSQLSAGYGVIDEPDGQFDLFISGSLDLVNAHLDLLIDSVPGQGASNLNQLANTSPWGGSPFTSTTLDTGFRPDHIFTSTFGGGSSLSYYNFDTNASDNNNLTDPANGVATSSGSVIPYFQERVNNAASSTIVQPANAGALTTGAEFAFSLSGLGYTSADYSAGDPIGVMALISYGSHYQYTNQWLAPLNPSASEASNNYFPIDLSNTSQFPGNQFFSVPVPSGYQGPTVSTAAAVNPNPVTGTTAALSVLGSDPNGESSLTYTWSTTGTPPAVVSYSTNGTNASKNTTATFTANGTYNFLVTLKDAQGLTTTSTVTATVTGVGMGSGPTITTAASASPSTVTGTTTALSVAASDPAGASSLSYTWVATTLPNGATAPTFSVNGTNAAQNTTATFSSAGNYVFQVTAKDPSGLTATSSVNVTVNQTVTSVTVTPATASVASEQTQQFAALVKDQFGNTISSPSITWSIASGTGTVSAAGLYTAPGAAGSASVKAVDGSFSGTAAVTITNAAPTITTAASASPSPVTGKTATLTVGTSDDGGAANLSYNWATTGTPPAAVTYSVNGTNAAKTTTATFTKAGSYTFQVTVTDAGGLTATSSVTVTVNQAATTVTVSPATMSVVSGKTQQFTATAADQFGNAIASPTFTWSVSSGTGTISTGGLYTAAYAAGSATVKAVDGSASGTAAVTITNAAPTITTAASASPSPVTAKTTTLSVAATDDGGAANLIYTWATTGTPPAAVTYSANGTNGSSGTTATFTKAGSYTFQVTVKDAGGLSTTSSATVTVSQTATTVTLSPATATVAPNATQQFTAAVKDQFGAAISSPSITWSIASGTGTISTSGLYTAPAAAGSATVKAVSGSVSGTAAVTISATNQAPTVATAASATPNPVTGTTAALSVLGADDGGEANLTYTWATTGSPPAAVSFSANGTNASKNTTATFTKAGSYTFQVTIKDAGGLTTTSSVTATVNQTITTVTVTPNTASVNVNGTEQFSAAQYDQFGAPITTGGIMWSVTSGTGTINTSGLYTAPAAAGSATITAASGSVKGTATVTITAASTAPIVVDGTLDARYGSPIVIQSQATNIGDGIVGSGAVAPYSQLSAGYELIDEANNQLDVFFAGSLNLVNSHLNLLIDSVPNAGVSNLSSLNNVAPYGTQFPTIVLDSGFQPDHIFTFAFGGGTAANYVNLDTGPSSEVEYNQTDPSQGVQTSPAGVPYFQEAINNAQQNNIIAAGAGGSVTTGMEFAFNLSALGYTQADYQAQVPIGIMAMITQGSNTVMSNQVLAPYTPNQTYLNQDSGTYTYIGGNFDFSNNSKFAGNQFFSATPSVSYYVNAGGGAVNNFVADEGVNANSGSGGGSTSDTVDTSAVTNPFPEAVYQSERYGGNFTYTLGGFVPGSTHTVTLGFAETYWTGPGERVFNVGINGIPELSNFDIFSAAGGKDKAINETFNVTADSNGNFAIAFAKVTDNAEVRGIEIV